MALNDQIMSDIKTAMKAKNKGLLETLRFLSAAIKNKAIEIRPKEIEENDVLAVLKKLVKQRKDSIEQFEKANRKDLVDKEKSELTILQAYLPEQMSEEAVKAIVMEVVSEVGATSMKEMGIVIKKVMEKTAGQADGKLISTFVKAQLGG